jgi:two-component system, NarL family, response regulator NreC
MNSIQIFIADDHALLRSGLRLLLESQFDMHVVGEAADGTTAVRAIADLQPDVVVLDLSMPGPGGTQTIEEIRATAPGCRVLMLTMHDNGAYADACLRAGAAGYVVKTAVDTDLIVAIRAVHGGRNYLHADARVDRSGDQDRERLSARERQVLSLLARGHTSREIATAIGVGVKTVETYRARLRVKLGATTRAELVEAAHVLSSSADDEPS